MGSLGCFTMLRNILYISNLRQISRLISTFFLNRPTDLVS